MLIEMDIERTLVKFIISNKGEETYYGVSTTALREYIYLMRDAKVGGVRVRNSEYKRGRDLRRKMGVADE